MNRQRHLEISTNRMNSAIDGTTARHVSAIVLTAALGAGSAAMGQSLKPYRLHVFRDEDGVPVNVGGVADVLAPYTNETGSRSKIGINNLGIVGGTYEVDEDVYHGFVWFPNTLGVSGMAFKPRVLLDIHDFGVQGDISMVNDVCASRALVGFLGEAPTVGEALGAGEAQAFELDLVNETITAHTLHTTDGPYSTAYGTNDGTTATIVGETSYDCGDEAYRQRAFRTTWSQSGAAGSMTDLPMESTAFSASSNDVGRSAILFVAAGDDNGCADLSTPSEPCDKVACSMVCWAPDIGALRWSGLSPTSVTVLDDLIEPPQDDPDAAVAARAVNDNGDSSGWGWIEVAEDQCEWRATFWNGSSTTAHNLGDTMPDGQGGNQSWAEGISRRDGGGCVTVVGMNTQVEHGLVWYGFDDDWCVADLNYVAFRTDADPAGDPPCVTTTYTIKRAFDINQYRHVTVLVEGPEYNHLGVLTSAGDFNGDLKVDGTDRQALLDHYCASGCDACELGYDLDGDDDVDATDLAYLIGTYYSGSSLARVPTICECSQLAGPSSACLLDEESALAVLGFSGWEDFCAWLADADADAADAACETLAYLLRGDEE